MLHLKRLLLPLFTLLTIIGCQKDLFDHPESGFASANQPKIPITISEAQDWFQIHYRASASAGIGSRLVNMNPQWDDASIGYSSNGQPIAIVPLPDSTLRQSTASRAGARLLFSKPGPDEIDVSMIVYFADSAYWATQNTVLNFNSFTGTFVFFDLDQNFQTGVLVINGTPVGSVKDIQITTNERPAEEREDAGDGDCIEHVSYELVECPEQAFSDCYLWVQTTSTICNDGGSGGGSSGSGGSGSSGNNGNNGNNGNHGGGGGGGIDPPQDSSYSSTQNNPGGNSSGGPSEAPYWQVFLGKVPVEIFLANGGELPEGFDTQLAQQFAAIHAYYQFAPDRLNFLYAHPDFIPVIYNAAFSPQGEEGLWVPSVLWFSMQIHLNVEQFEFLIKNSLVNIQMSQFYTQNMSNSQIVQALHAHLNLLMTNESYFINESSNNFPNIGTEEWANTLEPLPNAAELALAQLYPMAALLIWGNVDPAFQETQERFPNSTTFFENDNADAFRHAFFLARNTQLVGSSLAYLFSEAHESDVPSNLALAKQMDQFNNGVGIYYGQNHLNATPEETADALESALHNGQMRQILPQDWDNYPNNHGIIPGISQLVPTN